MALLDKFKKTLDAGAKAAKDAASNFSAEETLQSVKDVVASKASEGKEALEAGVKAAQEAVSSIDVGEVAEGAKNAAMEGANAIGKAIGDAIQKTPEEIEEETESVRDFVALLWCMAYADGAVTHAEASTLDEISKTLDENYEIYADELKRECELVIQEGGKEFGYQNVVKIEAQKLIESINPTSTDAKLICWNLLALANSDGLDESELDLIRFVGEKSNIDSAAFEELRNYSDAIVEVERSIEEMKQSGRSYGEIEPLVAEFAHREQKILEAAQSLITDR